MPLNDRQIRNAKPNEKKQALSDGGGLALFINPAARGGTKFFVYNFRFNGRQQSLRLGKYPDTSLAEAREKHQQARADLAKGINPAAAKQEAKAAKAAALANTFENIAREWHQRQLLRWKDNHAARVLRYFEIDVFPLIGQSPIEELRVKDIKAVLDRVDGRGATETAEKIRQWINKIFNHAARLELTDSNPAAPLVGYLQPKEVKHMPSLPRQRLTEFYQRLSLDSGERETRICLMLVVLCFARNNEIRGGEWPEIDWQAKTWTMPKGRMKGEKGKQKPHIIPLSDWALELLQELHGLTGKGKFMFPSQISKCGYICENILGKMLERMGYKGIATPHGFRTLASTVLNEHDFNHDAIERQLAHIEQNKVRAAYNHAEYMPQRIEFMQWYSDFLRQRYDEARASTSAS